MKKITIKDDIGNILQNKEISNIHFYKIDFSGKDLSSKVINDCKFESCNLSNVKFRNTTLNNIDFYKSKLLGINFAEINKILSNFNFKKSNINLSFFMGMKMKNYDFDESDIIESDFTGTVLEGANFSGCNLEKSIFSKTNLKNANFVGAYNLSINPNINNLEKTKFSASNVFGLLSYLDIIIE